MKKLPFYFLSVLALIIAFFALVLEDEIKVSLNEQMVEEKIAEALPNEFSKLGSTVKIEHLNPDFLESNQIHLTSTFSFKGYGVNGLGEAKFLTSIDYRNGKFYLKDPVINKDSYKIKITEGESVISDAKQVALGALNKFKNKLSNKGDDKSKESFDSLVKAYKPKIKEFVVENAKLQIQNIPLYSLTNKDAKHFMAALALNNVEFQDENLVVTLSPLKFLGTVFLWIFAALASVAAAFAWIFAFGRGGAGFLPFL